MFCSAVALQYHSMLSVYMYISHDLFAFLGRKSQTDQHQPVDVFPFFDGVGREPP